MIDDVVRTGVNTYLVRGTIEFEVEVTDVADLDEAKRIAETMEGRISPWASGFTDITEFNMDITETEDMNDD